MITRITRTLTTRTCVSLSFVFIVAMTGLASAQDIMPRDRNMDAKFKAPRYRDSETHPLRVVAYVLHPVGWLLREGIFRPLSSFTSSSSFTKDFFGYREPFDYRETFCFNNSDDVPDCHTLPPFNAISNATLITGGIEHPEHPVSVEGSKGMVESEQSVYFPDINFKFGKSTLSSLGKARARQAAKLLSSLPSLKIVVEGHTDNVGTDNYNMNLGIRRAESVIKELSELGVDPARMSPISYGEARPLFTEDEPWARAANRRVQFTVQGAVPSVASASSSKDSTPSDSSAQSRATSEESELSAETRKSGDLAPAQVTAQ